MFLQIQASDSTPIYLQIFEQVRRLAASGQLAAGERLPSVRRLAGLLLVNHNTVARAYRELERHGVVTSRQGNGVFVADQASRFRLGERAKLLDERVDRLLTEAAELQIGIEELTELLHKRWQAREDRMHESAPSVPEQEQRRAK